MAGATIAPSLPAMQQHFSEVDNVEYWVRLVLTVPALALLSAPPCRRDYRSTGTQTLVDTGPNPVWVSRQFRVWLNALGLILLGRALLGFSVAGIMITATAIADYYTGPAGKFLGLQAAFMSLSRFPERRRLSGRHQLADAIFHHWLPGSCPLRVHCCGTQPQDQVTSQANLEQPLSLPRSSRVNLRHCAINPIVFI